MKKICMFLATMSLIAAIVTACGGSKQHEQNHRHRNGSRDRNLNRGGDKREQPDGNGGRDHHHREHGVR